MNRDELIDVGARALYDDAEEGPSIEAEERRAGCWSLAEDVIDAVEPLIRADERARFHESLRRRVARLPAYATDDGLAVDLATVLDDGRHGASAMKPPAIIVDMDGTLANVSGIRHHVTARPKRFDRFHAESVDCPPNAQAVDIVRAAHAAGQAVLVVTARRHMWRHQTAWFLAMHDIPSDALIMRGNEDHRPDVAVKRDILAQIRTRWTPVLAVDDNPAIVSLWESEGIPTVVIPGWEDWALIAGNTDD